MSQILTLDKLNLNAEILYMGRSSVRPSSIRRHSHVHCTALKARVLEQSKPCRSSNKHRIVNERRIEATANDGENSANGGQNWLCDEGVNRGDEGGAILVGRSLKSLGFPVLAIGVTLLLHHGTAGNTEAVMTNLVLAKFPWEKAEVLVQPEPSKGSCATCIGVVDETLGTCNSTTNCVSSFDDRPKFFVAPWEFPGQLPTALKELKDTLVSMGADIQEEPEKRYVHAVFTDKEDGVIDDVEFLFSDPLEDATVVIRSASRAQGLNDNQRNRDRLEQIRGSLTWEQVPILRNRNRTLFFLESPWDSFGPEAPPTYDYKEKLEFVPE